MNLLIAFTFPILHIDLLLNFLSIYTSRRLNFFIFAGPACQVCNFDYLDIVAKSHPIVAVFHNLKGYDLHHILRNLGDRFTSVIANSSEKFLCAQIQHETDRTEDKKKNPLNAPKIKYIDSLAFLNSSLANLASNLSEDKFHATQRFATNLILQRVDPDIQLYPEMVMRTQNQNLQYRLKEKRLLTQHDCQDYRNWRQPPSHSHLIEQNSQFIEQALRLLKKKGYLNSLLVYSFIQIAWFLFALPYVQ